MSNKRDLKLDAYGIDRHAYRELYNFCLQYQKKKDELSRLHSRDYLLHPISYNTQPGSPDPGDPTAKSGERAARLSEDCELIEQAAREADPLHADLLLRAVTQNESWRYLRMTRDLEPGEKSWRIVRRRFYYILAQKKGMI